MAPPPITRADNPASQIWKGHTIESISLWRCGQLSSWQKATWFQAYLILHPKRRKAQIKWTNQRLCNFILVESKPGKISTLRGWQRNLPAVWSAARIGWFACWFAIRQCLYGNKPAYSQTCTFLAPIRSFYFLMWVGLFCLVHFQYVQYGHRQVLNRTFMRKKHTHMFHLFFKKWCSTLVLP